MIEWHLVFVFVGFVAGFGSGLIYALRLYKHMEANSDREWAKRHGMPEINTQRELPIARTAVLRRRIL